MRIRRAAGKAIIVALLAAPLLHSQAEPPAPDEILPLSAGSDHPAITYDGWHRTYPTVIEQREKPAPAPRHDLGGTWDPGPTNGIAAGVKPDDGNPAHEPPFTPLGREMLNRNHPSNGFRSVLPGDTNDPIDKGDPQGMPREDLYEL